MFLLGDLSPGGSGSASRRGGGVSTGEEGSAPSRGWAG